MINRKSIELLKDKENLVGAEIGVSCGYNAFNMLSELDIKKLYLIDSYTAYQNFTQEKLNEHKEEAHTLLSKFDDKIVWIEQPSKQAVSSIKDNTLDFIYIDGDHNYLAVINDIDYYYQKLKVGGLFAGDNFEVNDVRLAVLEFYTFNAEYLISTRKTRLYFGRNKDTDSIDWWIV
jgi:predicted O-methyltransferase YrrM